MSAAPKRYCPGVLPRRRVVVITDANIDRLYPDLVRRFDYVVIGHGESSKTLVTVQKVYRRFMELGVDRSTFVLGIGGGIVTDIAGFVASTYMRGLDFGFISTTLLGQVDASVGGKNGVNLNDYKNMIGTFTQPCFVISDVSMLRTLPLRELRAGMAEVIKTAVIGDRELFEYLETHSAETFFDNPETMCNVVWSCVSIKAGIVERDEREADTRRLLNLGHTMAHAIEKCAHEINHGEAVAMGIAMICAAAVRGGMLAAPDRDRIHALLEKTGFTLTAPRTYGPPAARDSQGQEAQRRHHQRRIPDRHRRLPCRRPYARRVFGTHGLNLRPGQPCRPRAAEAQSIVFVILGIF